MTGFEDTSLLRTATVVKISTALAIVLGLLAILFPRAGEVFFRRIEQILSKFAERRALAIGALFFSVMVIRVLVLPLLPVPVPGIHDEYSYLLMADTFVHGRLANPPHPMWVSFETFHVNWFPRYASMYPPAQGFALALGQWLGHAWIGVLLSDAAMCAAILWMLQGWMPARWALLGGTLAALKFGLTSYWMNSYWGGALAAIGGALLLGALARVVQRPSVRNALLLGLGIAVLANSRPYEGFLLCIPAAAGFLWWLAGKTKTKIGWSARVRKVCLPLGVALIFVATFMGYYNWRLTGNALLMPHVLNMRTYHTAQLFLWGHAKPEKNYRNQQMEDFYNQWERGNYDRTMGDIVRVTIEKVIRYGLTYLWVGALFALPGVPFLFRDRRMRLLLIALVVVTLGVFTLVWSNPHYAAPIAGALFAVLVQAIRHLRTMRAKTRPWGVALSRAIVILLALDSGINIGRHVCDPLFWTCQGDPSRAVIEQELKDTPGKHLVMVRYEEGHNVHDEWVFNGADLNGAKVLWARELDAEQNARLFAYFKDRQVWLVTPDSDNTFLETYTPPDAVVPPND